MRRPIREFMRRRRFFIALVMSALFAPCLWSQEGTSFFPLSEIRPGLKGVGRTVFEGFKVEEFQVEILGVLKNAIAPKRSVILARLSGGPLEKAGVIAGMSGSPVYVDGKLVGAVSLSFPFAKEPLAGITPIEEMLQVVPEGKSPPASPPAMNLEVRIARAATDSADSGRLIPDDDSGPASLRKLLPSAAGTSRSPTSGCLCGSGGSPRRPSTSLPRCFGRWVLNSCREARFPAVRIPRPSRPTWSRARWSASCSCAAT